MNSVTIEGNTGAHDSWIMLSSDNYNSGSGSSRGLSAYGVRLINNNFTHIWYNLSRYISTGFNGISYGTEKYPALPIMNAEFDVQNNSFNDIINKAIDGILLGINESFTLIPLSASFVYKQVDVASPSINISNNRCSAIAVSINGDLYNDGTYDYPKNAGAIQIHDNILQSSSYEGILFDPSSSYATTLLAYGIKASGNMTVGHEKCNLTKITNNIISNGMRGFTGLTGNEYDYLYPIYSSVPCDILNNTIEDCICSNLGIYIKYSYPTASGHGDNTYIGQVCNNTITRGSKDIISYIYIRGDDKIKSIAIKDNIFDGYTVTDTPTTLEDHYSIKFSDTPYDKVSAVRNVGQMFFTDLTPNVNTEIGHYDSYIAKSAVGWKTFHNIYPGPAGGTFYISNEISTSLDLNIFADATTYNISPLVINLPSYDGANGLSVSFVITGTDIGFGSKNIRIYASSQISTDRSLTLIAPSIIIYPVTNITNSVSNYFTTDFSSQLIHINIEDLYNTYYKDTYISTDKYFPLFLSFVDESSPTTISTLTRTTSTVFGHIHIDQISGQFRY